MNKILKISVIILLSINCAALNAQITVSQSSLMGIAWTKNYKDIFTTTMTFTNETICRYTKFQSGNESDHTFSYYLSDEIPESFDNSKVGNVSSGKYIIEYNSIINEMFVTAIFEVTNEKLVIKSIPIQPVISRPPKITYINLAAPPSGGGDGGKPKPNTLPRE